MERSTFPQLTADRPIWTAERYREAVEASSLRASVRNTLHAMVDHAAAQYSTIDRATLLQLTGGRREATVTAHWDKARSHGLLVSKQRFNTTSIHKFTIPGADSADIDVLAIGMPLRAHLWTPAELAWWDTLSVDDPEEPPWSADQAPF